MFLVIPGSCTPRNLLVRVNRCPNNIVCHFDTHTNALSCHNWPIEQYFIIFLEISKSLKALIVKNRVVLVISNSSTPKMLGVHVSRCSNIRFCDFGAHTYPRIKIYLTERAIFAHFLDVSKSQILSKIECFWSSPAAVRDKTCKFALTNVLA